MAEHPLLPKVDALRVAEYTYQDPRTGLTTIYNIFNGIASTRFPTSHQLAVFTQVSNVRVPTPLRLRMIDADEAGPPLFEQQMPLPACSALNIINLHYNTSVIIPAPGMYRVQLLTGSDLLHERLVEAKKVDGPRPPAIPR